MEKNSIIKKDRIVCSKNKSLILKMTGRCNPSLQNFEAVVLKDEGGIFSFGDKSDFCDVFYVYDDTLSINLKN
jgi:hypothetical protein